MATAVPCAELGYGETQDRFLMYTAEELLPSLSDEEKSLLRREVITAMNNELVRAEDLEMAVPRLVRSCTAEAKELRREITSLMSSQMVESQRALQIVGESHQRVQQLREMFLKQGELIQGMYADSATYQELQQLHILRENVSSVIRWTEALRDVRYTNLYGMVEEHQFRMMYDRLKQLQSIRRTVIQRAGAQYATYESAFEPYFSKLYTVLRAFVHEVLRVLETDAMNVAVEQALEDTPIDVARGGNRSFAVLKQCMEVCAEEATSPVLSFAADGIHEEAPIHSDNIRAALYKSMSTLWEEQIMVDVVDPYGQISIYLEQMKKIEPILEALEMTLLPLSVTFPFFGMVVGAMHQEVLSVIRGYADPGREVEAMGRMEAFQFLLWYREMLIGASYAQYVELFSIDDLCAALMTAAVGGLSAHLTVLCRACAITVCTNPTAPHSLPNGHLVTTGPMDLFAVLQQTLNGLNASMELSVMRHIGRACAESILAYLEECRTRCDYDFWDEVHNTAAIRPLVNTWEETRLWFLVAMCNDCTTIENHLDGVELKFALCWDGGNDATDADTAAAEVMPFQRVQDALHECAFFYVDEIVEQMERVAEGQWRLLFRVGPWYINDDNQPTQLMLNTQADYLDDLAHCLPDYRLRKVSRKVLVQYVERYIAFLMEFLADVMSNPKKHRVEDWNAFIDGIARDTALFTEMWSGRAAVAQGSLLNVATRAFDALKALLGARKPVDFDFYLQSLLIEDFGDCPTFVIRYLVDARARVLDKETRERMLACWSDRIAFQRRTKLDTPTMGWNQPPSFFGSLDRSLGDLDDLGGFFTKGTKKRRTQEQQRKRQEEKEAKRLERQKRRERDAATPHVRAPSATRPAKSAIETETLANLLK